METALKICAVFTVCAGVCIGVLVYPVIKQIVMRIFK
jgi:hypothetical protein